MILYAKTMLDQYAKIPRLTTRPQFITVYYGWYSFSFLFEDGDFPGPECNNKAIDTAHALLLLSDAPTTTTE